VVELYAVLEGLLEVEDDVLRDKEDENETDELDDVEELEEIVELDG
jgi:hypothetical protein